MSAVVFVGPSLDLDTAAARLRAEFRAPIKRGDIDALLVRDQPPATVGIIDGAFLQSLAISPKEVLRAIDRGVVMFGSSSMGALRAVECAPFGMIGVGRIYAEYQSGSIDADDEVAIVFDPSTGRALSEPMINMRFALAAALSAGVVSAAIADRFIQIAKGLYFPDRTIRGVLRLLAAEVGDEACARLHQFIAQQAPDTKREDAIALLDAMRTRFPEYSVGQ
jgi:hypothetical protein